MLAGYPPLHSNAAKSVDIILPIRILSYLCRCSLGASSKWKPTKLRNCLKIASKGRSNIPYDSLKDTKSIVYLYFDCFIAQPLYGNPSCLNKTQQEKESDQNSTRRRHLSAIKSKIDDRSTRAKSFSKGGDENSTHTQVSQLIKKRVCRRAFSLDQKLRPRSSILT